MKRIALPWPNVVLLSGIDDPLDPSGWFSPQEIDEVRAFHRETRRREWMLSRIAAKQLALELGLASEPAQCSFAMYRLQVTAAVPSPPVHVSLSHSGSYAAAVIGEEPVGIDVQVIRELPERATHLFLSDEETAAMQSLDIENRILHFWCAKEAAWKRHEGSIPTLRQVPLHFRELRHNGLRFEDVETIAQDDFVIAVTRVESTSLTQQT